NDPIYMECPDDPATASINDPLCVKTVEAGQDDGMGGTIGEIKTHLMIPIKIEKAKDAAARAARSAVLGVAVPYVKLGDIEVEVEYTITNLDPMDAEAKVELD